nr:YadA-like family protein [uncultured Veillonella sp.]
MNKIFKVIWSKSKQCYVVVSEMAKNTTGKKKIVVASILAGLAMSTMGTHVMAVSTIPFTDKPSSALANGSVKNNTTNGVAIGNAAYSDSHQSIAIGFRSFASGTFLGGSIKPSVAVGAGAHAEGNNTVAIGTVAENRASYGVALGNESKVTSGSDYGIAIGYQTQVSAVHGMAIGEKASASGLIGMALGANAQATGAYSYAGGFNSASGGEAAIAVGKSASASGESAVAVGNGTVATGGDAVAIGTSSQATGGDSIALGKNANASNGDSIAIGQDTVSDKINSVALGKTSQATGASATALGPQAKATGSTAVAIGLNSEANQSATVAVGYNSAASGENAAAYGNTAKAVGKNSLALGANTQATVEGGVALGAGSIANTVAGAGYNPNTGRTNTFTGLSGNALTSTWAAVSIGDGTNTRQLTGLAAGTNNTDAVNVAQLKSMNLAFTADGSTKGDVNLTNSALNVVGDSTYITTKGDNQTLTISGKKQTITVTNGTASASAGMADANNVAQAINQANAAQTISYKANGGTANTVKVSDGLNFTNGASTVATVGANGQVTYDLNTTTKQSITDSSTAVNRTIALGSDSGSTTAKKLSTSAIAFNIKGDTGANALITTTATGDNVSITPTAKLTNAVAAAENAANKNLSNISSSGETVIKNLAKGAAQDAVKVAGTGLATVSDNTVGGVKTYTVDVNTGNLVVTANGQVGAAGTTGASGATGSNGVATTQNVATAINDAVTKAKASTTQALADAEHKFAGDTGTTSVRKHGEVLSIKGGVTTPADLSTGNIGVVSDGAGTLNIRLAKVLSGLTSATFTTAGGNTTVINGDGVTITPSGTGASAISMTTDGINAGGTEIKNIADGTAADSAVSKGQMETAIANVQTAATSTEKVVAKTLSGDNNLATVTGQTGTAKGETYEVAVSENAVKNVAKAAAQDAVTVTGTGLATVSDNTAAGVKTYTVNVDEGKLVIDDTTGKVGAAGSTQGTTAGKNGVATTQNVATAINDAVTKANANNAQALADAKHNFAGDDATVISRKHGEQLNIKGGASTTATDLTSGNIAVVGDTASGTLNIKMAKALTGLTSATFTDGSGNTQTVTGGSSTISDAAGNSTVVSKGGVTTTDAAGNITTTAPTGVTVTPAGTGTTPISVTTSGISAGNKEIKNIANGTTDDAAVNKKQMDDAVKAASDATKALGDNTVSLGSESGSTTAKKLSTTGGITFNIKGDTGANALITTSATGDNVTIAPTAKLTAAVTAAEKSADKDLSNLSTAGDTYIKNLAKTAASWNVETNGGGTTAVAGGESVNFINGDNIAITNAGRAITIGTAKNVSFDKVTVGGIVLDKTNGINAGGKEVKGIADGTAADSAVSKGQMETAIANAQTAATSTEKVVAKTLSGDTNLATVTGQTGTAKGETYEVAVSENAVKNVAKAAAQDAVTVTGTGLATVSDNTAGGVKTYTVNVEEGKLVLDDTTGQIGANGATQGTTAGKNGIATTQNVATAINDAVTKAKASTTQALADAEHKFDGDTGTTSVRKHGEVLSIKGGVTNAADLTTGNIGVVSDGAGTLNIRLAKVLSGLTSATFTTAGGNTTVINGDGVTITPSGTGASAISMTTDGINAGGKEVKGIADGTAADSAVSKGQMETAIANATTNAKHNFAGDDATVISRKHGEQLNIKGGASTTSTDLTSGNIAVVGDTASGTLNIKMAKALTGLTSATFTDGSGNTQTVTGASSTIADGAGNTTTMTKGGLSTIDGTNTTTVAPAGVTATDGTNTVKLNGSGIDAGNTQIKNVGKATTDDAAVNKKQMDDAVKSATDATTALGNNTIALGSDAGSTTAKKLSTNAITFNIKGDTGANALITTSATSDNVTIAPTAKLTAAVTAAEKSADKDLSNISSAGKTVIKDLAVTSAQDAVNVTGTGLATVSDNTTGGVKTYTVNVDEGKLVLDDTTGKIGANGSTQGTTAGKNGVATTQNVATAINDAITKSNANTAQALADAEHKFDGDTGATSVRKHGEVLSIKGGVTTPADLATGNIGVVSDGAGTLNIRLAKVLSGLTSATFKDASGNTTMVTGGSTTIADTSGNTQTLAPTKSEIKDNNGVSTVTTKDGVTAKDASGQTTSLTKGGVNATDGNGHTTGLTNGGLSTTDGTNTTTVAPTGITATDGTNTVKLNGSGIDAGGTEIKNVGKATTDDAAVNKKQMDDAITKATADATHDFAGDDATVISRKHGEQLNIKGGASTTATDLTSGNIAVIGDTTTGTLNIKLAKVLTGLTSATFTDTSGNTTTVTGGSTTIADTSGNTQTLAPTKSEIKDNNGVSTVTTKDGVTAKDASGQTTSLTKGGVNATDGNGHTTGLTNGGLSTTDGTNTTTVAPTGITATDGTNTVKLNGSGIDAGGTEIKNVGKATTDDAAVNKKQMDDAITKATADATHEFGGDDATVVSRKHGEKLTIKGGATTSDADLTSGNIAVIGDATSGALNIKLAKALTGLTSATFTDTAGNTTTVTGGSTTIADTSGNTQTLAPTKSEIKDNNGVSTVTTKDGVTAKDASGQTTSLTKGGVDATDGNGNTTSLTNTGVSATDGNGHTTGLTNGGLSTTDGTNTTTVAPTGMTATDGTHTVKVEGSGIDADGTEIKHIAAGTAADSAVNKGQMDDAITKATTNATHEFGGDDATVVSRKHGEKLTIKGGASTSATDLTSGNIAVIGDTNGTLNLKLAKALTGLTSATFTDGNGNTQIVTGASSTISDAAGNSTVVSKGGVTTTDAAGNSTTTAPTGVTVTPSGGTPISITTDGINAGGKEVKGIANGTTSDAAVNKGQMDAAVQNALDGTKALGNNTITLGGDTGFTDAKKLNTSGGIQFNINGESGANALIKTTASGNSVSIAATDKLRNAVAAAENAANKDLSNLSANGESRIKDLAKSAASWNVQTNGSGTTAVSGGDTVNFVNGKNITITNTGREIKVATKDDVSFDKVTVGGMTLDNNGIDAGNKEIKNVAAGTTANSAVNKQQLDTAIAGVSNINYTTSSITDRAGSTPVHSVALSTGFDFKGDGNIQITQDAANNGVIHYAMNPNLSGITSITGAGNGAPTMTFNSQNGNTPANVSINSNLDMGGHRITGVGPAEKPTDAVNKQQVDQALRGLAGLADNAARQYASKAGANAAALAALKPIQYDPLEPTQIMAGVGNYKSQTAVALGMAHYTNENTMFNIGVSLDSHDNMVNAGVTHKFGYSPEKKAIPDRYKGGPISSIYVMQDEMQALLAKDQEKDAVISKQASEIDTLRQQNEDMQRKIDMILAKLQ